MKLVTKALTNRWIVYPLLLAVWIFVAFREFELSPDVSMLNLMWGISLSPKVLFIWEIGDFLRSEYLSRRKQN